MDNALLPVHSDPTELNRLFHSTDQHAGQVQAETDYKSRIAYAPVRKEQIMKDRNWIYGVLIAAALLCGYMAMKASGSDNFIRGFDFTTATGLVTGAELEDLLTRAQLASTAFDPSNTNRLFDTAIFTGKQAGATWILTIADKKITTAMLSDNAITTGKIAAGSITWPAIDTNVQYAISNSGAVYNNDLANNIAYSTIETNGYTTNSTSIADGITKCENNIIDVYGWSFNAGPYSAASGSLNYTNATRPYGVNFTNLIFFEVTELGYCNTTTVPISANSFSNVMMFTNTVLIHAYNTTTTNYSIHLYTPYGVVSDFRKYYYGWRFHAKGQK